MSSATTRFKNVSKDQLIKIVIEKEEKEKALVERLEKLEKEIERIKYLDRIIDLERQLYQQQQYSRRECIEVVNIPTSVTDGQPLEDKVIELFQYAGVNVRQRDFHAIHRLANKNVVISKCVNRRDAIGILKNRKKLREATSEDKNHLGIPEEKKIYVNESLCPQYRRLYGLCNTFFKKKIIASCYTINGTIKAQVKVNGPKKDILHMQDLIDLVGIEEVNVAISDHEKKQKR